MTSNEKEIWAQPGIYPNNAQIILILQAILTELRKGIEVKPQ